MDKRVDILKELNPEQLEAVTYIEGPLLIVAGAGSGKTRILTYKFAYLVSRGFPPSSIIAVTFTNKAADEMLCRVRSIAGKKMSNLHISTFHALGLWVLRKHIHLIGGYDSNFSIVDTNDQKSIIKEAVKDLNMDVSAVDIAQVMYSIAEWKRNNMLPEDIMPGSFIEQRTLAIYRRYQKKLRDIQAVDFGDLLLYPLRIWSEYPDVLEYYQSNISYLLIDEYQDVNPIQYDIARLLCSHNNMITAVGDPDQSIYGWRGADISNILSFERDFPNARIIKLERNYRSTKTILKAANSVIVHNRMRKDKRLWTENEVGSKVVHVIAPDEDAEARFIISKIVELLRMGYSFKDFAVFYRMNAQSRLYEEYLLKEGLPYRIVRGLHFYERKEIKDLLAYLNILSNPRDTLSLRRIINVPSRGIGAKRWEYIYDKILSAGDIYKGLKAVLEEKRLKGEVKEAIRKLFELISTLRSELGKKELFDLVAGLLEESGYWEMLKEADDTSRMENIEEFFSIIRKFQDRHPNGTLQEFLEEVSLSTDVDTLDTAEERISLMTLHSAKGLEFPVVFMVGMEDGVLPHYRSVQDGDIEEERRLCYVGMTRAKKLLFLTSVERRLLFGAIMEQPVSRFVREMDESTKETIPLGFTLSDRGNRLHRVW
ncbi:MAG: UvrD-helicase domain-containing protein [Synergistetes bacterium]|nr:UvrD-helicase domain-containing protein [Synergistota bacterium]